jgi:hypothetical protein
MAKCPKCGKEINHLDAVVTRRDMFSYHPLDSKGEVLSWPEWEPGEQLEWETEYWKCPECYARLNIDVGEDDAIEFLTSKGKYAPKSRTGKKRGKGNSPHGDIRGVR